MKETRQQIFSRENVPSYLKVMMVWAVTSALSAWNLRRHLKNLGQSYPLGFSLLWGGLSTMAGMGIMFGASVINLRKLAPGFERLARGEKDPEIPPVWCPVLTMARHSAIQLCRNVHKSPETAASYDQ
jgi:hypothetical protein